ncbi:unnamed protein product [Rotaria sp. Silwood1]|nr:unnamed protein product [Rotaria sp. Silwood1]
MKTGTNQSKRFHSYAYLIATPSQALTGFKIPVRLKTAHNLVIQYASEEDSEQRKAYYHAKSPTNYAFKIQITCDFNHRIVHASKCYHGDVLDITILRESRFLEHTKENVQIIADKGYIGEQYVITPRKKPRGGESTAEDKDFNRSISSARAAIENINQRVKNYAILGSTYKEPYNDFEKITKITHVVAALCNLKLIGSAIAETFKISFASISNVTSICGTPRGAGGITESSKLSIEMVVLRLIKTVITPPTVSIPY